jgi:cell division protein FtsQ
MDGGGRFVRPVTKERQQPRTRGKSGRSPSRGISRGRAVEPRRGKASDGVIARLAAFGSGLWQRPMLLLAAGVVIVTGIGAVVAGNVVDRTVQKTDAAAGAMVTSAGFGISQVHLSGNNRTKPAAIMAALGFRAGQPIFDVSLRSARARLLQLPWVADAEVKRRYPDDISVQIVERTPYARWQTPRGVLVVVERRGRIITSDGMDDFGHLPLLLGNGAPEKAPAIVAAVARHRAVLARVEAYQFQSRRRWNLLLDDGVIVKLPETGWDKQLAVLDHLIVDKGILESDIKEIDLRHPAYYFFVRRGGTEQKDRKPETGSAI